MKNERDEYMENEDLTLPIPFNEEDIEALYGEIPIERIGFFSNVKRFFKKLFKRNKQEEISSDLDTYSKFKHFYEEMERDDPNYLSVRHAATLCDEALRVAKQRLRVSTNLNLIDDKLGELQAFINLSDEELKSLKIMLERFVALAQERSVLLEKLTDYDASLVDMEPLKEDAKKVIPSIKEAERNQRALRQDIGYLTGEKEELINERQDMLDSRKFIRKFTTFTLVTFAFMVFILIFIQFNTTTSIFIPTTILVLLAMVTLSALYVFNHRIRRDLKMNMKKQHKAIELLNKKTVVYAYYTNFLRFCYKKYKAKNSRTLERNLSTLESYRHLANRIDTVRNLMYETETGIERFVRDKKLGGMKATIEGFAKTVNLDDKKRHFTQLKAEKESVEHVLVDLDKRHEEIWDVLVRLNNGDDSKKINAVVEMYINEAEKLFTTPITNTENEEEGEPKPIWKLFEFFVEGDSPALLTEAAEGVLTDILNEPVELLPSFEEKS